MMSILIAVIFLILSVFLYKWLFISWNYWTSRKIPSVPGALPIFGNTMSIFLCQENLSTFCTKIYEKYQNQSMVGFYNLKTPVLMVKELELVKTVLQTSFHHFHQNEATVDLNVDPLLGHDLFFVEDYQKWKDTRVEFNSILTPRRMKIMSYVIANVCKKLDDHLADKMGNNDGLEVEAKFLFSRYIAEVAAGAVFGIEGNSFMDDYKGTLLDCLKMTMDSLPTETVIYRILLQVPLLRKLLSTRLMPVRAAALFEKIVKDVENSRQEDKIIRADVLQLMFDRVKSGKISSLQGIGLIFSFCLESYGTSSLTLSLMTYLIAKHPDVQNKIRAEVERTLGKYEDQLTYEAINEMSYLEQVMNETMRLYPVVGAIAKICVEPCRLMGSDGLTVDVERNTPVYIPVMGLQMDPEIWKNPEQFNPDRFEKGTSEGRHKFVFLPFSEGPRSCPGKRFAAFQVKAAIATFLKNYRVELSPKMLDPIRLDPANFWPTPVGGCWLKLWSLKNQ